MGCLRYEYCYGECIGPKCCFGMSKVTVLLRRYIGPKCCFEDAKGASITMGKYTAKMLLLGCQRCQYCYGEFIGPIIVALVRSKVPVLLWESIGQKCCFGDV